MEYRTLGNTDQKVSLVCLGTMTWGNQNSREEGLEQMDYALDQGVNFFDAAEMYPVPPTAERYGHTEEIIGEWFASRGKRDEIILATKVAGRTKHMDWLRDGAESRLNKKQIHDAVDASLKRLKTDRIDLYQLHWPDRLMRLFGGLNYRHYEVESIEPAETLSALAELVKAGKIRWVGLSNETPWGLQAFLKAAEQLDLPRVVSVQNAYNLLNRTYELGLSEFYFREQVGLLAYSPLGQGVLSGKYLDGAKPSGARFTLFGRGERYQTPRAEKAIRSYMAIAARHALDPTVLANAFVASRPFVTSNIIGATSMEHLRTAISACQVALDEEVIKAIEDAHLQQPNPCP